jgi:hypothetical protein
MNISTGNMKMRRGFLIWNILERLTCPGATPECIKRCYAHKQTRRFEAVRASRLSNYHESLKDDFSENMISLIQKYSKRKAFRKMVRIHEAGDFYSQTYVDKWIRITTQLPDIKFLAFTKSFHLDFSKAPSNLSIIYSIFPDTPLPHPEGSKAYSFPRGEVPNDPSILFCSGTCDTCMMCWNLPRLGKHVCFEYH